MVYLQAKRLIYNKYCLINPLQLLTIVEAKKIKNFELLRDNFTLVNISRKQIFKKNGRFELENKKISFNYQRKNHLVKNIPFFLPANNTYMLFAS